MEMLHLTKMIIDHHVSFSPRVHVETVPIVIFPMPPTPVVRIPITTTIMLLLGVATTIILSVDHVDKFRRNVVKVISYEPVSYY